MDYEFYHYDTAEDIDFEEQMNILSALDDYDRITRNCSFPPNIPVIQMFNLFYGIDPTDGCYRWQLHFPNVD